MKEKFKSGEINPEKLREFEDSNARLDYFKGFLDEANAKNVNALFESKVLLKNQQQGYINWAKQIIGAKPEVKRDIISRIEKMDKFLNPAEEKVFNASLAESRLGFEVSFEEAKAIMELSDKLRDASLEKDPISHISEKGWARVAMENLLNDFKVGAKTQAEKIRFREILKDPQGVARRTLAKLSELSGTAKSIQSSLDNSFWGRQGIKSFWVNPKIWLNNFTKSFKDIGRQIRVKSSNRNVMDSIKAEIYSRGNYTNGKYKKMGIDIGGVEEAYPTSLPEKIPYFGRLFTTSEVAFKGGGIRMRADLADYFLKIADKTGVDITDIVQLKPIGKMVNSLTGRGALGILEPAGKQINQIFYSLKFLKGNFDILTAHTLSKDMTPFVRKQAALNLLKIIGGTTAVLATAKALGADVETDPRSSDFGKIRIGDTRFDVTGGMASLITLAWRLKTNSTKSSTTGKISKLGTGYGQTSGMDVVWNALENKLSPAGQLFKNLINRTDWEGKATTPEKEAIRLITPMPVQTFEELIKNPNSADIIVSMMADLLGFSTNTYSFEADWTTSEGKELMQFKQKIGEEEFKKANNEFNQRVNQRINKLRKNEEFKNASEDEQADALTEIKDDVKKEIFNKYKFKYKKQ